MKKKPSILPKLRAVRVTDPERIGAVLARPEGKWKEHIPHYEKQPDGSILLEVKNVASP